MQTIKNISTDRLGHAGLVLEPGETAEVTDHMASAMASHPSKYEIVTGGRSTDTIRQAGEKAHGHSYRKNGTCACGRQRGNK
ncbi:MAG: hypothetical protein V3S68_04880 [Dehalococcoidia bacterium]